MTSANDAMTKDEALQRLGRLANQLSTLAEVRSNRPSNDLDPYLAVVNADDASAIRTLLALMETHVLVPNETAKRYAEVWLELDPKHLATALERETLERGFALAWRHLLPQRMPVETETAEEDAPEEDTHG